LERSFDVTGLGGGHGLHRDGGAAAYLDGADGNLASEATGAKGAGGDIHSPILPGVATPPIASGRDWR
jgi:hypothetical protein